MLGSCLCGSVEYEVHPPFKLFQYCHCSRCRKVTGTAHGSNLFVAPEQFRWIKGEDMVGRYEVPDAKYYATGFCKKCGSSMPWLAQGGRNMVVPAGSLDEDPEMLPRQIIYWESKACWYVDPERLPKYDELPPRN